MKKFLTLAIFMASIVHSYGRNDHPVDSLGLETKNGLVFILHKVEAGQTLYSLSKRYKCNISEVIALNAELNGDFAIKSGQQISFPYIRNGSQVKAAEPKPREVKVISETQKVGQVEEADPGTVSPHVFHVVKDGETVYSISRTHNISQEDLIRINNIVGLRINPDQKLLIDKSYAAVKKSVNVNEIKTGENKPKVIATTIPSSIKLKKVKEVGIAEVINTGNKSNKHLALHRTAPIGSFLTVTNEATGDSVQVKVVGNMNEVGSDQDILVKISPSAFSKLKPRDSRIRAAVSYNIPR